MSILNDYIEESTIKEIFMNVFKTVFFVSMILTATVSQAQIGPKVTCTSLDKREVISVDFTDAANGTMTISETGGGELTIPAKIYEQNGDTTTFSDAQGGLIGLRVTESKNGLTATSNSIGMGPEVHYTCKN
jgi:hypothetical protein